MIKYFSTNGHSPSLTFSEALLKGLAPDGGLYMPDAIPRFSAEELKRLSSMKLNELAAEVLYRFTGTEISRERLSELTADAYNFDVPLEKISGRKYILRLDRGPTASFKDFAARMMSRLMQHFLAVNNEYLTILTATSGDTGSAVASAFYGMPNIKVIILFPKDEVSDLQRKQMTTLRENISVIAVNGKFDDCQHLVKKAFLDASLSHLPLSSANSINIGRLIPQSVYYFYAWSRLALNHEEPVIFSVPSGNFGNVTAGLLASKMGLPVERFIIATNENDEVPEFLRTGKYFPVIPSKNCISSAMNVGHPSNLPRIIHLYGGNMDEKGKIVKELDMNALRNEFFGVSVSDEETSGTIAEVFRKYGIFLEPHGAIAWNGLEKYLSDGKDNFDENSLCISLETAHPAKFPEEMRRILKTDPPLPPSLSHLQGKKEYFTEINNDYLLLKDFIIHNS